MTKTALTLLFDLARLQSNVTRAIDGRLGGGLGFNDIMILSHLSQAEGEQLRRIDLADKVGLTPSGITRLLAPMEKIGLISRLANEHDARVSLVVLAPGGKRLLSERLETAERLAKEYLPSKEVRGLVSTLAGLDTI